MLGLLHHAARNPDHPAYVLGLGDFVESYGQLESRSRSIAHFLRSLSLREGDSVALMLGNVPSFFDVYWATQRIGLYLTVLNWHLSAAEIAEITLHSDARVLICGAEVSKLAGSAKQLLGNTVEHYLSVGGQISGFDSLDQTVTQSQDMPLESQRAGSVMVYSSGTTGKPKGIRRALPNCDFADVAWTAAHTRFIGMFGFKPDDRYLCPAPLYHAAPLRSCTAMQVLGGTVHAMPQFDAHSVLRIIEGHSISVSQWVPTHFRRLLDVPAEERRQYDVSSLRVAVHAAAPCPLGVKYAMIEWWGPILLEYYAGTEGGGTIIGCPEWLEHPGSVGKPWAGADVAILGEDRELVPTALQSGAVYFRDQGAAGSGFTYYKDPERTADAYHGPWFTLGDIGYLDQTGYLYLTDRASDLIISGGVNIYPQEVENCLIEHPAVADVAVIGVPDAAMGEQVKAVVIPRTDSIDVKRLAETLMAYTRERIAHFKCPRTIDFVKRLPRTETGKLQRRVLREQYKRTAAQSSSQQTI